VTAVERSITGYHQDDAGDWVAELVCGHNQHVRHRPPFQMRPWVLTEAERQARIGAPLECPLCDRAELPAATRLVRSSPEWDEGSLPPGLRRAHRLGPGTWGRIVVKEGRLLFSIASEPRLEKELTGQTAAQAIPPDIEHEVRPVGPVRLSIEFLAVDRTAEYEEFEGVEGVEGVEVVEGDGKVGEVNDGGDPACWAGLICPECGAVTADGYHRPGCAAASMSDEGDAAPPGRRVEPG
jgi:tellurite methyltransferase